MILGDPNAILPNEAHELFWKIFEMNVVPMATWDFEGHILNANPAFLDMIGYSKEDLLKKKINYKKITPSEYQHLDETCKNELKTQFIAIPFEKQYIRKDGKRINVRVHAATHDLGKSRKGITIVVPLDGDEE